MLASVRPSDLICSKTFMVSINVFLLRLWLQCRITPRVQINSQRIQNNAEVPLGVQYRPFYKAHLCYNIFLNHTKIILIINSRYFDQCFLQVGIFLLISSIQIMNIKEEKRYKYVTELNPFQTDIIFLNLLNFTSRKISVQNFHKINHSLSLTE